MIIMNINRVQLSFFSATSKLLLEYCEALSAESNASLNGELSVDGLGDHYDSLRQDLCRIREEVLSNRRRNFVVPEKKFSCTCVDDDCLIIMIMI